jgi:GNAT superfamily N-acetyltransferase
MAARPEDSKTVAIEELTTDSSESARAEARELLLEYGRFVVAQPGAARFCYGALEVEAANLPLSYVTQGGGCLMARVDTVPSGFVAWRVPDPSPQIARDAWELKRLWVRPTARGLNLGRTLTLAVIERAVTARRKAIYLDTAPQSMSAAHRLYLEMGFVPCPAYNDNPVENLAYLVKFLAQDPARIPPYGSGGEV